jgi:hypothetical protein
MDCSFPPSMRGSGKPPHQAKLLAGRFPLHEKENGNHAVLIGGFWLYLHETHLRGRAPSFSQRRLVEAGVA